MRLSKRIKRLLMEQCGLYAGIDYDLDIGSAVVMLRPSRVGPEVEEEVDLVLSAHLEDTDPQVYVMYGGGDE